MSEPEFYEFALIFQCLNDQLSTDPSAITGFLSALMLGISGRLIPWGLRLPKKSRHPLKSKPAVTNGSNQATTSREEWWGSHFRAWGWILLAISFFIQIFVAWP